MGDREYKWKASFDAEGNGSDPVTMGTFWYIAKEFGYEKSQRAFASYDLVGQRTEFVSNIDADIDKLNDIIEQRTAEEREAAAAREPVDNFGCEVCAQGGVPTIVVNGQRLCERCTTNALERV